jgi:[ribosomal protein S18]-alanine N-acetyltransferase
MHVTIRPLSTQAEAGQCAHLMSTSEPWITLARSYEASLQILTDEERERYVAYADGQLVGFLILNLRGAFVGCIQTVCVAPGSRDYGFGRQLIAFAEERIFREHPNVFMCVSSFNQSARRLYERLGYAVVGELTDFIVAGHAEILLRKTHGPLVGYAHASTRNDGT